MYRPATFDPPWIDYFTNPCPYYIKQYKSFPKFLQLPAELQLMIWEAVEPEARVVVVTHRSLRSDDDISRWLSGPFASDPIFCKIFVPHHSIPAILSTCYNARKAALKHYEFAFANLFAASNFRPQRFNFEIDTLQMTVDSLDVLFKRHGASRSLITTRERATLSYLAIEGYNNLDDYKRLLALVCFYFRGLKQVFLCFTGQIWEWDYLSAGRKGPVTKHPHEIEFFWQPLRRSIYGMNLRYPGFIDGLGGNWEPPILTFGHRDQWRTAKVLEKDGMDWETTS
ncbi:hypothetical protein B0J14DRAFT_673039 [Halenospora varia]|nr:hypothetical protein B0J14DRAFT_673039 [Halenospora varia]